MDKVRYEEMLPHEIVEQRKKFPAAFIGLGLLEWHCEHLAVGTDALKSEKLCEIAALRSGGFAFPTLWYGEPRVTGLMDANHDEKGGIKAKMKFKKKKFSQDYFGKTGEQQIEFYQQLVYHTLVQMNTLEMKAVCLLYGHYPMRNWALPAVNKFNKSFKDTKVFADVGFHYVSKSKRKYVGCDHSGKWETSCMWYLRPDCVDMSVFLDREKEPLIGTMGEDPRKSASIEVGRKYCELIVEGMVRKAKELIKKQ